MNLPFISGEKVILRPLERSDLTERYLGWLNDPEVTHYTETGSFPSTMTDLHRFYEQLVGSRDQVILAIAERRAGEHIGNVKLAPINWIHRKTTLGILIGEKEVWGHGVGEEAARLGVEYGFSRLNVRRIELGVFACHQAAVRCYEKVGFRIEGRLRQALFHRDSYQDCLWMGLLASEYRPTVGRDTASGSQPALARSLA
jgi:[ribosomal protein S5]-alanine N-acetyltransferase